MKSFIFQLLPPVPTITAVGVANPRAQGHAITITAIAKFNAKISPVISLGNHSIGTLLALPIENQTSQVNNANTRIMGTKIRDN